MGALIYLFAAFGSMEIDVERFIKGIPRGKRFLIHFFHQILQIIVEWFGMESLKVCGWQSYPLSLV